MALLTRGVAGDPHQTQDDETMLVSCWPSVVDIKSALVQRLVFSGDLPLPNKHDMQILWVNLGSPTWGQNFVFVRLLMAQSHFNFLMEPGLKYCFDKNFLAEYVYRHRQIETS